MERRAVHNALGHYPRVAVRRSRSNIRVVQKTHSTSDSVNQILSDFVQNTSLLGISHFLQRKSIVWLILYIICFSISILQSWNAGRDLFSNKGSQTIMVKSIPRVPMPSVTFCSYALLPKSFDLNQIKGYVPSDHDHLCGNDSDKYEEEDVRNDNAILQYLRNKTDEERTELSVNMTSIIHRCKFREADCNYSSPEQFYFFNNPYYGNCFTFNPAFNTNRIEIDITTRLTLIFRWNSTDWTTVQDDTTRIGVLLHPPGTAPVLESSSVSDFRPGDSVEYTLTLKLKLFKKGLATGCVDRDELKFVKRSKFYSPETPYLYSVDACMKSCAQNYTMNWCKKIDPILPVQPNETGIVTEVPPISNCSNVLENVDMESCGCPLPCEFISYDSNPDTTKIEDECAYSTQKKAEPTKFSLNFLSTIVDIVEEEAAYSLTQFLGLLGGNLSLWIGLCVISLLEIVELVCRLLKVFIMSRATQKSIKPEISHGHQSFVYQPDEIKKSNFTAIFSSIKHYWNR